MKLGTILRSLGHMSAINMDNWKVFFHLRKKKDSNSSEFIPVKASQSVMLINVSLANQLFQILNIKHFFAGVISYIRTACTYFIKQICI